MSHISQVPVPDFALLRTFRDASATAGWHRHLDCFVTDLPWPVALEDYVRAFYDSLPFRLERLLIAVLTGKRSSHRDVVALAAGGTQTFCAWVVLQRTDTQLLLGDYRGNTRSWLAVTPAPGGTGTRLHFGSGIRAIRDAHTGAETLSWGFRALGGFHIRYSRILLGAARRRLPAQG